jgi:excisionase family DNA binding protein
MATVQEVAARMGLTVEAVQHALREGKLRGRKIGRMWFVGEEAIREYEREHLGRKGWTARREGQRRGSDGG